MSSKEEVRMEHKVSIAVFTVSVKYPHPEMRNARVREGKMTHRGKMGQRKCA